MSEDQRIPGHPADKGASRTASAGYGNASQPMPAMPFQQPLQPSQVATNNQTRNIAIGAIATIIASTSVYYLTQYVNLKKTEATPSYLVSKEATINAWNRYVTMDNIYYKSIKLIASDKSSTSDLDKYKAEMFKLSDEFIQDASTFQDEKNVDKNFVSMVNRRTRKEKESQEKVTTFYNNLKSIAYSNLDMDKKYKKVIAEINYFREYSRLLLEMSATEVKDLSKALSASYGTTFDPQEFLIYKDYKKGKINLDPVKEEIPDSTTAVKNINPQKLVGKWKDGDNLISMNKDGSMNYSLGESVKSKGVWKIEKDKLKLDSKDSATGQQVINYFFLYDIRPDTFVMIHNIAPYEKYTAVRVKEDK